MNTELSRIWINKKGIHYKILTRNLKTKVVNHCSLPVITLTLGLIHKLKIAQCAMETAMLGVLESFDGQNL